jgi:hypothetical protein
MVENTSSTPTFLKIQDMRVKNEDVGLKNEDVGLKNEDVGLKNEDVGLKNEDMKLKSVISNYHIVLYTKYVFTNQQIKRKEYAGKNVSTNGCQRW